MSYLLSSAAFFFTGAACHMYGSWVYTSGISTSFEVVAIAGELGDVGLVYGGIAGAIADSQTYIIIAYSLYLIGFVLAVIWAQQLHALLRSIKAQSAMALQHNDH